MSAFEELGRTVLRNRLLGRWAAEKMDLSGPEADAYVESLAGMAAAHGDVFCRIKQDFDAAGIAHGDETIALALTEMTIKAGTLLAEPGSGLQDAAALAIKRNLSGR